MSCISIDVVMPLVVINAIRSASASEGSACVDYLLRTRCAIWCIQKDPMLGGSASSGSKKQSKHKFKNSHKWSIVQDRCEWFLQTIGIKPTQNGPKTSARASKQTQLDNLSWIFFFHSNTYDCSLPVGRPIVCYWTLACTQQVSTTALFLPLLLGPLMDCLETLTMQTKN